MKVREFLRNSRDREKGGGKNFILLFILVYFFLFFFSSIVIPPFSTTPLSPDQNWKMYNARKQYFEAAIRKEGISKIPQDTPLPTTTNAPHHRNFTDHLYVVKRSGEHESIDFNKITRRIESLMNPKYDPVLNAEYVDCHRIAQTTIQGLFPGVHTSQLDDLAAENAAYLTTEHPDYDILGGRIMASNLQKQVNLSFSLATEQMYRHVHTMTKQPAPLVSERFIKVVRENSDFFDSIVHPERDFRLTFFSMKTLMKSYLLRSSTREIQETPQYMYMRIAIGIHFDSLEEVKETYDLLSLGYYSHATPTMFNAGTEFPQLSSCFLLSMQDDSIPGIYETLKRCAIISKYAGGIGLSVSNIRASKSYIRGTNGTSNGLVPMLKVFSDSAKYVDQCVTRGTRIVCRRGVVPVERVSVGDEVLCSDREFHPVLKPLRHHVSQMSSDQTMYRVYLEGFWSTLEITGEHPLWVLRDIPQGCTEETLKQMISRRHIEPQFTEASDVRPGDKLIYPIPSYEKDHESLSENDCRMYGILLSKGHFNEETGKVHVVLHTLHNEYTMKFLHRYLSTEKVIPYQLNGKKGDVTRTFTWSFCNPRFPFTEDQIRVYGSREKRVDPMFLHLPRSKALQVLRGVLETRGKHIRDSLIIHGVGKSVMEQLAYILFRCGVLTIPDYFHTKHQPPQHRLKVPLIPMIHQWFPYFPTTEKTHLTYMSHKGYLYVDVHDVKEWGVVNSGFSQEILYDLEVDHPEQHNYCTLSGGLVHNGGGKRKGSWAMFLEPWHADIEVYLDLKKNTGKDEIRARDLFYGLWVPGLFMDRVAEDGDWSLFCPNEAPGLTEVYGEKFKELYERYEHTPGLARKTMKARALMKMIITSQVETGTPYFCFKDASNEKTNQKNVGLIRCMNLCTEVAEVTGPEEISVCNLASICFPKFVKHDPQTGEPYFDHQDFHRVTKIVTRNQYKVLHVNYSPLEQSQKTNMDNLPIGIGPQGYWDACVMMRYPYESEESQEFNRRVFETMYHGTIEASVELAKKHGPYRNFPGSPASQGLFQFDLWGVRPPTDSLWDWETLKEETKKHGWAMSLHTTCMPTASTAQILDNNESFEPKTSNVFTRGVIAGTFTVINKYLVRDLIKLGLWTPEMRQVLRAMKGSIQQIDEIPDDLKKLYKTVWEMSMKTCMKMSADRAPFIDQSQSLNNFMEHPTLQKLQAAHMYAYDLGLKTGMYYLRTKGSTEAVNTTVDPTLLLKRQQGKRQQLDNTSDMTANGDSPIMTKKRNHAPSDPPTEDRQQTPAVGTEEYSEDGIPKDACMRTDDGCVKCKN